MVSWKNISSEFTEELKKEWENKGFSYEGVKDWISAGLRVQEFELAEWLRDTKKFDSEWVLNYVNIEDLRQEFQEDSKKRDKNKEINASGQNLEGDLDLSDFISLEKLDLSFNMLTEIKFISTIKYRKNNLFEPPRQLLFA